MSELWGYVLMIPTSSTHNWSLAFGSDELY